MVPEPIPAVTDVSGAGGTPMQMDCALLMAPAVTSSFTTTMTEALPGASGEPEPLPNGASPELAAQTG